MLRTRYLLLLTAAACLWHETWAANEISTCEGKSIYIMDLGMFAAQHGLPQCSQAVSSRAVVLCIATSLRISHCHHTLQTCAPLTVRSCMNSINLRAHRTSSWTRGTASPTSWIRPNSRRRRGCRTPWRSTLAHGTCGRPSLAANT